jgi:hypothetical protein
MTKEDLFSVYSGAIVLAGAVEVALGFGGETTNYIIGLIGIVHLLAGGVGLVLPEVK